MKKLIITLSFLLSALLFFSCTKDQDPLPDKLVEESESPVFNSEKPEESGNVSINFILDISEQVETDTIGSKIARLAEYELFRGPDDVGIDINHYPYKLNDYMPQGDAWCSEFVAWVYCVAGWPLSGGSYGGWMLNTHTKLRDWFSDSPDMARWHEKGLDDWYTFSPKPGDYIRFIWTSSGNGHSGIVRSVVGKTMYTVEGNYSNQVKIRAIDNWRLWSEINGIGTRNLVEFPVLKGKTVKLVSRQNELVLSSKPNSNYIVMEENTDSDEQLWKVSTGNYGFYLFENIATGLFLNTDIESSFLMAYDNNDERDKLWKITGDGLGNYLISNFRDLNSYIDVNSNNINDYARVFRNNYKADKFWGIIIE